MKNYMNADATINFPAVPYKAVYLCETVRGDWKCDAWAIMIDGERFEYFTGLGHRKVPGGYKPKKPYEIGYVQAKRAEPKIEDVLYNLILDSDALDTSFDYWCDELGYDTDSRKAFDTYQACCENAKKIKQLFDSATIAAMREFFQY